MTDFRVLDLFSGIGGFSLGLECAGMRTMAFCECDGYARRVLRKHWPDVWLYEDVKTLTARRLKQDGIVPNVIVGGLPCQDISCAGKGAGIEGGRSGLWSEMLRLIKEVKPVWVIAENVPALRSRGADRVLADLEGAGYTAEPIVVGAWAVGAPHKRDRVWIVANARSIRWNGYEAERDAEAMACAEQAKTLRGHPSSVSAGDGREVLADASRQRRIETGDPRRASAKRAVSRSAGTALADAGRARPGAIAKGSSRGEGANERRRAQDDHESDGGRKPLADSARRRGCDVRRKRSQGDAQGDQPGTWPWTTEPDVGRVADGVPARLDRLRCLGNAVVPAIPELIGRWIVSYERTKTSEQAT